MISFTFLISIFIGSKWNRKLEEESLENEEERRRNSKSRELEDQVHFVLRHCWSWLTDRVFINLAVLIWKS